VHSMLSFSISYPYFNKISWLCGQQQPGSNEGCNSGPTGHDFTHNSTIYNKIMKRAPIKHKTSLRIKISIFNLYAEIHFDLSKNLGCELQVLYTVARLPKTLSVVQKNLEEIYYCIQLLIGPKWRVWWVARVGHIEVAWCIL